MANDITEIDNGAAIDTGYGFIDSKGIEVCSDSELQEVCVCAGQSEIYKAI